MKFNVSWHREVIFNDAPGRDLSKPPLLVGGVLGGFSISIDWRNWIFRACFATDYIWIRLITSRMIEIYLGDDPH